MRSLNYSTDHVSDERLARLVESKLEPDEVSGILDHLDGCGPCERRFEEVEPSMTEYRMRTRALDQEIAKLHWPELGPRLDRVDALRRQKTFPAGAGALRSAWIGAIAAGLLTVALLVSPHGGPAVGVETLLQRARVSVEQAPRRGRLRINTRRASFIRTAVMRVGVDQSQEEERVRAHFAAARYDWADPLNPKTFSEWRRGLASKSDSVTEETDGRRAAQNYTVRTTTGKSSLREASLTLEAPGMMPVGGKFIFADQEWVEVTAIPDAAPEVSSPPVFLPRAVPAPERIPGPGLAERELRVRAAVDAITSDGNHPVTVDVQADGSITVTPYRLTATQDQQLRENLAGIDAVTVLPQPNPVPAAGRESAINTPADRILDSSQAVSAEAHALGQLAERFNADAEAQLNSADRLVLRQLRVKHWSALTREIETLWSALVEDRPELAALRRESAGPARGIPAVALVAAATEVNRLVTILYATADPDPGGHALELAAELAQLRQLCNEYAREHGVEAAQ